MIVLAELATAVIFVKLSPFGGANTQSPVAHFTISAENLWVDNAIQFTDASIAGGGTILSTLWHFGDGTTSRVQNPVHVYTSPGTYVVTLTVTDTARATNYHSKTISVSKTARFVWSYAGKSWSENITITNELQHYQGYAYTLEAMDHLYNVHRLFVRGNYAYLTGYANHCLVVVDISDPTYPKIVGAVQDAARLAEAVQLFVDNKYAYVTSAGGDRLTIVDVSNPSPLSIVGSISDARLDWPEGIWVSDNYAYVCACGANSFTIVDVSNPTFPTIVGSIQDNIYLRVCMSIGGVADNRAYLSNWDSFVVVDVSDPRNPTIVPGSWISLSGLPSGLCIDGKYVYSAGYSDNAVSVIDVGAPDNVRIVGTVTDNTYLNQVYNVRIQDNYVYAAVLGTDRLTIIDVSNPGNPTVVGSVTDPRLDGAVDVRVAGRYAYVAANYCQALTVVDVSDSASPRVVGSVRDNGPVKFATPGDNMIVKLVNDLKNQYQTMDTFSENTHGFANFALAFVQAIGYRVREKWQYPVETLANGGDCYAKSLLYASILKTAGYDVCLLNFPSGNHMMVGAHLGEAPSTHLAHQNTTTKVYTENGKEYYPCETTQLGWTVGEINVNFAATPPEIIVVI